MDVQSEKHCIRAYYDALDNAALPDILRVMADHCTPSFTWRGFHPFNEMDTPESVADVFWRPFRQSFTRMTRRMDVFFAGQNQSDEQDGIWVCSMGHLMGLFDEAWLGIPPTGKMAFLPYCAFHRVVENRIVEEAMYFDLPHLMRQAGLTPFPPQTAAYLVQPGPASHDGLLFESQPPETGQTTLALIEAMIADLGQWANDLPLEDELARTWHNDMIWWGPTGIGATYTIERYAKQHSGPFRAAFAQRSKTSHLCRMAEGHYGGFFGWPNFTARPRGGFMGMPATNKPGEFRVIDVYRRDGDKLAENWVFIDLLYFWKQQGVDILARTTDIGHRT